MISGDFSRPFLRGPKNGSSFGWQIEVCQPFFIQHFFLSNSTIVSHPTILWGQDVDIQPIFFIDGQLKFFGRKTKAADGKVFFTKKLWIHHQSQTGTPRWETIPTIPRSTQSSSLPLPPLGLLRCIICIWLSYRYRHRYGHRYIDI